LFLGYKSGARDRKDKLFDIIKFNNNLLNLSILNSCLSNDLARLLACCLAKISLIVLTWLLEDSGKLEELLFI